MPHRNLFIALFWKTVSIDDCMVPMTPYYSITEGVILIISPFGPYGMNFEKKIADTLIMCEGGTPANSSGVWDPLIARDKTEILIARFHPKIFSTRKEWVYAKKKINR